MNNMLCLVGRIVKDVEIKELENGGKTGLVTLAIPRNFKNIDGIYETDFIDVVLYSVIAQNTMEYCRKGDLIGIKGRLQSRTIEENDFKYKKIEVVAERVTFLSSKKNDFEEVE